MNQEKVFSKFNVYYCISCYKNVLKSLEDSVEMPAFIRECNTYDAYKHVNGLTPYYIVVVASVCNHSKWKFTNDSRRDVIKGIKKVFN